MQLIKSDTAIKKRIWNGASREAEDNLIALVSAVLDPLRRSFGQAIKVTSGYRCAEVNKTAGGVTGSQHLVGEAADIVSWSPKAQKSAATMKAENYVMGRLIVALGQFDQVIFENVSKGDLHPEWIHVSWKRRGENRNNILAKVKGVSGYRQVTSKELGL